MEHTQDGWRCRECGDRHDGLVTCIGPDAPHLWVESSPWARLTGWRARSFCRLRTRAGTRYLVRGHAPVPLRGHREDAFLWNVWVEVTRDDYRMMARTLSDPGRVERPPVQGTLETSLPYSPGTSGLAVEVHHRAPGSVPHVIVRSDVDHPLRREQLDGMDLHRLAELNALLHDPSGATAV